MAFMAPPETSTREDRLPVLGFNAKAGRLFLHDRVQQPDGEWTTVKTDVTMRQPAFAVDFGRLETGWVFFSNVGPLWSMSFYGQPMPACPDSPGNSANGKALRYKAGFRLPVIGQAIGGVREFAGNAGALINGMNELHTLYEGSPEGRAGKIPLVQMTNVLEVRSGQSSNFQPVFTVLRWVDRPADLLGPRTVPAPGGPVAAPVAAVAAMRAAAARVATDQRFGPSREAANETLSETRYAPPVDRWDDEPPARMPVGASSEGRAVRTTAAGAALWADDEIPF
jgi:hypothetical protein